MNQHASTGWSLRPNSTLKGNIAYSCWLWQRCLFAVFHRDYYFKIIGVSRMRVCLDRNDWSVFSCQCCGICSQRVQANEADWLETGTVFTEVAPCVCGDYSVCSLGQLCRLSALLNLHSSSPLWQDSVMYIYKMCDQRSWPFSVIGRSFSCSIGTFPQSLRLRRHISENITLQAIIMTDRAYSLCLLCLQKSQFCSERPVFKVELRFADLGQSLYLFAEHSCYKADVWWE